MSAWNDEWLQPTLAVKRGLATIDPRYAAFVDAFERRFQIRPLYVELSSVILLPTSPTRLVVCLERPDEVAFFMERGGATGNRDLRKQREVLRLFLEHADLGAVRRPSWFKRQLLAPAPGLPNFVAYTEFESAIILEILGSVQGESLRAWEQRLVPPEMLWCTQASGNGGPPHVFTLTEEQARWCRDSGLPERWSADYLELARTHDEFGYLQAEHCSVAVDSKENFDKNFGSNWFYYWR